MDFLRSGRPKVLRTRLYGDQEFSRFELEILHTPIVQRLYNLKQLGFTDRVYPDAVHSRFNHLIGVTEIVEHGAEARILAPRPSGRNVLLFTTELRRSFGKC